MNGQAQSIRVVRYLPAIIMGMGAFIATFDVTAVSLALPAISQTFSLDVADYVWVMNAYSLAFTIMLIAAGAISDRHGHRLSLVSGALLFLIASILCAFATNYAILIGGRILQGVGAAFIVCGGYALMGRLYTDKADRVQAFAIMGTIGGSALAVGPGLGGIISSTLGWEWVFLVNIPVCGIIIVGSLGGIQEQKDSSKDSFDIFGVLTFSLLLLISSWCLLHGPIVGNITVGMPTVVMALLLLLALFIWIETKVSNPAIELSLFKRRSFVGLAIVPLCLAVSYWSLIVYIPLFLESVFRIDIQKIAYIMLFFTVPMFLVPYMVTGIATKSKDSSFYSGGLFVVAAGCLCISIGAYLSDYAVSIVGMVVAGAGAAAMQTQVSGALIASAPEDRVGAVSAIMTVLRQGGFAVGTAFLSGTMQVTVALGEYSIDSFTVLFLTCAVIAGVGSLLTLTLVFSDENAHRKEEQPVDKIHEISRATIEDKVAAIWRDIFEKDTVNPDDHFFDLGGNSLAAVKFLVEIENSYGADALTPDQLYKTPTFDKIVSAIEVNVCG